MRRKFAGGVAIRLPRSLLSPAFKLLLMADASVLRGNPAEFARVSELLAWGCEDFRAGLADVDSEVSRMLDGWRGDSGGVYGEAWREWHEGAARIKSGLSLMASLLGRTGGGYQHQEGASSEALREVAP